MFLRVAKAYILYVVVTLLRNPVLVACNSKRAYNHHMKTKLVRTMHLQTVAKSLPAGYCFGFGSDRNSWEISQPRDV